MFIIPCLTHKINIRNEVKQKLFDTTANKISNKLKIKRLIKKGEKNREKEREKLNLQN